ncbi:MAG: excinuclease ABC subunit UvrC [bacterium]|nr:excinuclease ABC subunit UvrC [bacterium]
MTTDHDNIIPVEDLIVDAGGKRRTPEEFQATFDISRAPTVAGCYIMRDTRGKVIYVGKAKNLRARLRSYINESDSRYRVKFLMKRVARIEFLVTTNEKEALLLENSLIKKHRPRYNVRLRDDKTYVSVKVSVKDQYPRVTVTRKIRRDGSRYFGPYADTKAVRQTVTHLQRIFPLRTCSDSVLRNRTRPCLYHQMKQCCAPCVDYVTPEEYAEIVEQVLLVLDGRSDEVEKTLLSQIEQCAGALEFEKAAEVRDRLYALRTTLERQRTVASGSTDDRDVFGVHTHGRYSEIQILFFRHGKLTGGRSVSFNQREMPLDEVLGSFLLQYYSEASAVPSEVLVPVALDEADTLAEILSEARGAKVNVLCPQRGEKVRLVEMAGRNAKTAFEDKQLADKANADLVAQVKEKLKLRHLPVRIECFDISTIQGTKSVGSMVTFEGGQADKSRYRRFSIKSVEGQDDFGMMREVLLRRYTRAIEEDDLPDLVLIDGGKGQLNVASAVLADLGIEDLEAVSIAKARAESEGARSMERFFLPGRSNPVILRQDSPVVLLMARIRDEAHRFAITYHRKRRQTAAMRSTLLDIPGVGDQRAKALLRTLGSMKRIRSAPVDAIASVPGVTRKLAQRIKDHLGATERKPQERKAQ